MSKNNGFQLTDLEKAVLLKKRGEVLSILEGRNYRVEEIDGVYDPERAPEGDEEVKVCGFSQAHCTTNLVHRVTLSGQEFVILTKDRWYPDFDQKYHERGECSFCGTSFYVFRSEGPDLDALRVKREKMEEILARAEKHLPEALEIFREEYVQYLPPSPQ